MSAVTTTRSTLDIKFHVQDGTVAGNNYTWKLNYPLGGASSTISLNDIKVAFGFEYNANETLKHIVDTYGAANSNLTDKDGNTIDGIDGATIVTTVTTKNELS